MNPKPIEQAKDPDLASSFNAIRRAAERARQIAAQTGTFLVVRHGEQIDRITVTAQNMSSKNKAR
jgi:DNA-directed RNA polymerase subunit K/omega